MRVRGLYLLNVQGLINIQVFHLQSAHQDLTVASFVAELTLVTPNKEEFWAQFTSHQGNVREW